MQLIPGDVQPACGFKGILHFLLHHMASGIPEQFRIGGGNKGADPYLLHQEALLLQIIINAADREDADAQIVGKPAYGRHAVPVLQTVSYTHLDVYKRQGEKKWMHMSVYNVVADYTGQTDSCLIIVISDYTQVKAVSYTHLDVYKRQ